MVCAFCRTPHFSSEEEDIKRMMNLMEKGNAGAFYELAEYYDSGDYGLQQDWEKANELWLKAGELGCAEAYSNLGCSYDNGTEVDRHKESQALL